MTINYMDIYEKYYGLLMFLGRKKGFRTHDLEDIVQDTMIQFIQTYDETRGLPKMYIKQIFKWKCSDYWKENHKELELKKVYTELFEDWNEEDPFPEEMYKMDTYLTADEIKMLNDYYLSKLSWVELTRHSGLSKYKYLQRLTAIKQKIKRKLKEIKNAETSNEPTAPARPTCCFPSSDVRGRKARRS